MGVKVALSFLMPAGFGRGGGGGDDGRLRACQVSRNVNPENGPFAGPFLQVLLIDMLSARPRRLPVGKIIMI